MQILKLIKKRKTTRKYLNKPIPAKILNQIIEAGIWGPAIHGFQPWKFVIITNKKIIKDLLKIIVSRSKDIGIPSFIIMPTIKALSSTSTLICVYRTNKFSNFATNIDKNFTENARSAELSAISAAIQNIILVAADLKIGTCWLNAPLFFKKEINKIIKTNLELVAILTIGYPDKKNTYRSRRINKSETIKYLE